MRKNRFRGDYLELRYNTYYAIYFVPERLRDLVGKTKYTKTTRTSDKRVALDRAALFVLQWKNEIAELLSWVQFSRGASHQNYAAI